MSIHETRWMMEHFDPDPIEVKSIELTKEILKTLATLVFALAVVTLIA